MNRFGWILIYWLAGFGFWLPSIVTHAIRARQFGESGLDLIAVLVLPIVVAVLSLELFSRKRRDFSSRGAISLWMLFGVWMLGPLCTLISASFAEGGFTQPGVSNMLLLGVVLFVPLTFAASAYDGTLFALAIVTVWFIMAAIIRPNKVLEPRACRPWLSLNDRRMKLSLEDPKTQERREARRFQFMMWIVIVGSLVAVWLLYEHVSWVRTLLGTRRGTIGLGVLILASPLILIMYLLEKRRK